MTDTPQPKLVQLDPPGPYILPTGQEFLDLRPSKDQSQAQTHLLRVLLERGAQLHLPMKDTVWQRFYVALKALMEPQPTPGNYKRLHPVSKVPPFVWMDRETVSVEFLHSDGIADVLLIPSATLVEMQAKIVDPIAQRPRQT